MIRSATAIACGLGLALATAGACAEIQPVPPTAAHSPLWTNFQDHPKGYIATGQAPNGADFLPPPPATGSARQQADVDVYRATRALENGRRWAQAAKDAEIDTPLAPHAFDCVLGATLDPDREPVLVRLLARAEADVDGVEKPGKARYARPRPFVSEDRPTCVAKEDWLRRQGSYPSGHAGAGWAWALILAELAPDRADAIFKRGLQYGDSRVVCGVHYVSDIQAGRIAGAATVARLHADPAFQADLKRARTELADARARGGPPPGQCVAEAAALESPQY